MNGASSNENSVSNAQEVVRTDAELQQAARAIQEDLHEQRNIMLKRSCSMTYSSSASN